MSGVWVVDVWFSTTFPCRRPGGDDWRRVHVVADDATDAQLLACLVAARPMDPRCPAATLVTGDRGMPVRSIVVDWP